MRLDDKDRVSPKDPTLVLANPSSRCFRGFLLHKYFQDRTILLVGLNLDETLALTAAVSDWQTQSRYQATNLLYFLFWIKLLLYTFPNPTIEYKLDNHTVLMIYIDL